MKNNSVNYFFLPLSILLVLTFSMCRSDKKETTVLKKVDFKQKDNVVRVRMPIDPRTFNPLLYNDAQSRIVFEYIFPYLMTYDPLTLESIPQLVESKPIVSEITTGPFAGNLAYTFTLQEKASWDDGTPVTGYDMAFTLKAMFNPLVGAAHLRSYFDFIQSIEVDPQHPKTFTINTQRPYMLQELGLSSLPVMPAAVYDPDGLLNNITLAELTDPENANKLATSNEKLKTFAEAFASPLHTLDPAGVSGPGPYKLVAFETGQATTLVRKDNWWGNGMETAFPSLKAFPQQLIFQVIKDQSTTISAIKDEAVDVAGQLDAKGFTDLQKDSFIQDYYGLYTPTTFQFYYIGMNNKSPFLSDKRTRRALAHIIDIDEVLEKMFYGLGERIVGPFHPKKPIYNPNLKLIEYDIDQARKLLTEAGWKDSDGDGILDKEVNGKQMDFKLNYLEYQASTFGSNMTLYFKEQAKRVGIEVNINSVDRSVMLNDLKKRNFDLFGSALSPGHEPEEDPKSIWHTESDHPDGLNRMRFSNPNADALIDKMRITTDAKERKKQFFELQEILYDEQPVIFLFAPFERLAFHHRFEAAPSAIRPGFQLGGFRIIEELVAQ
ncbi:MAG: ABC transporter substrate-binding protein [Saprospiraceae bacterium]